MNESNNFSRKFPISACIATVSLFFTGSTAIVLWFSGIQEHLNVINIFRISEVEFSNIQKDGVCARFLLLKMIFVLILILSLGVLIAVSHFIIRVRELSWLKTNRKDQIIFGLVALAGGIFLSVSTLVFRLIQSDVRSKIYSILSDIPLKDDWCGLWNLEKWLAGVNVGLHLILGLSAFIIIILMAALSLPDRSQSAFYERIVNLKRRKDCLSDVLVTGAIVLILIVVFTGIAIQWPVPIIQADQRSTARVLALMLMALWGGLGLFGLIFSFLVSSLALARRSRRLVSDDLNGDKILRERGLDFSLSYFFTRAGIATTPLLTAPIVNLILAITSVNWSGTSATP